MLCPCGWLLLAVLQRLTQQLSQVEHQQSLAASEAALAPLNPFQRSQVWMQCSAQPLTARAGWQHPLCAAVRL